MITVIGAGVSGLTTAVALRQAGFDAHIVAAGLDDQLVSWVAAAIWTFPDLEGAAPDREWALKSRQVFDELAGDTQTGVRPLYHLELFRRDPGPIWWETTPWITRLTDPPSGYEAAVGIDGFCIEPPVYLPWLRRRFVELGGTLTQINVRSFDEVRGLVVNCTGLGAADLANDRSLYPIRGQVLAVRAPSIQEGIADESDPGRVTYIYPRSSEVIVGGTREAGVGDLAPDAAEADRMLADASQLDPRLAGGEVIEARVGLRPGRHTVRLDPEVVDGRTVVHNYGHAGHGYLLSWGCAEGATELVRQALR